MITSLRSALLAMIISITTLLGASASAHTGDGVAGGFFSGFLHPVLGWDHVAAMVAVGLWGAFLRAPAIWILPVVFPLVMALGGAAGVIGVPLAGVEAGIAISSIVLGGMVAFAVRPPLWIAAILVAAFAIFHGYAHGTELPAAANAGSFATGFVLATGILHLLGIGFGFLTDIRGGALVVRGAGAIIALAGIGFLTGIL